MVKKEVKSKEPVTREYTINLHKRVHGIKFKGRAPRAIKEIKAFAGKAMGTKDVRVDVKLNKAVWSKGIKNVPFRLRIVVSRRRNEDEDAKVLGAAKMLSSDCLCLEKMSRGSCASQGGAGIAKQIFVLSAVHNLLHWLTASPDIHAKNYVRYLVIFRPAVGRLYGPANCYPTVSSSWLRPIKRWLRSRSCLKTSDCAFDTCMWFHRWMHAVILNDVLLWLSPLRRLTDGRRGCAVLQEEMYSLVTVSEDQNLKGKGTITVHDE